MIFHHRQQKSILSDVREVLNKWAVGQLGTFECSDSPDREGQIFLWQAICRTVKLKQPSVRIRDLTFVMVSR